MHAGNGKLVQSWDSIPLIEGAFIGATNIYFAPNEWFLRFSFLRAKYRIHTVKLWQGVACTSKVSCKKLARFVVGFNFVELIM